MYPNFRVNAERRSGGKQIFRFKKRKMKESFLYMMTFHLLMSNIEALKVAEKTSRTILTLLGLKIQELQEMSFRQ